MTVSGGGRLTGNMAPSGNALPAGGVAAGDGAPSPGDVAAGNRTRPALGVFAAFCTCLLGLGLARFAYTPLIPALIGAHWFTPGQAVYLGAANIAGYLGGAAGARSLARRVGVRRVLRLAMAAAAVSLLACALQAGFAWVLAWRLVSGLAGAVLMVLAAPTVLPLVPQPRRGLAGGIIFLGIGLGMVASGTVLPVLLRHGVVWAWLWLGLAGLGLTLAAWPALPPDRMLSTPAADTHRLSPPLRLLCAAYGVSAFGQVAAILFLADFVARGLHGGTASGSHVWIVFGLGALAGPLLAGETADRVGAAAGLRGLWLSQASANAALGLVAWHGTPSAWLVGVCAAISGAGIPALVVFVLGRSQVLAGANEAARGHAWSSATIAFAAGQAVGAYALSYLFALTGRYDALFAICAVAMLGGLGCGEAGNVLVRQGKRLDGTPELLTADRLGR